MGERAPQHVQNIVIRDFCKKNSLDYQLSAAEYKMKNSFLILKDIVSNMKKIDGIVAYSLLQLPSNSFERNKILKNIDCKMSRIELYFQEIDRRIKSGIPFTPPSSRSNSLSNSENDKLSGDDKSSLSPTVLNNEKVWKEVK